MATKKDATGLEHMYGLFQYKYGESLEDTAILACQHMLFPNTMMLTSFYEQGLRPQNLAVISKSYSHNEAVAKDVESTGAKVFRYQYDSHESFDTQFNRAAKQFISSQRDMISNAKRLIVIDDGGMLLSEINNGEIRPPIYGVEQTSSGYQKLRAQEISFPVVNVARSYAKLTYEPQFIISHALKCLDDSQRKLSFEYENALVIGNGVIGNNIAKYLSQIIPVQIVDENTPSNDFKKALERSNLIVGCSGTTSIPHSLHKYLRPNAILCSLSSSDREFDSVHFRRQLPQTNDPHADLKLDGKLLLNSGFPVTFRGKSFEGKHQDMCLTHSLMLGAAFQSLRSVNSGVQPLDEKMEQEIVQECGMYKQEVDMQEYR